MSQREIAIGLIYALGLIVSGVAAALLAPRFFDWLEERRRWKAAKRRVDEL